MTTIDYIKQLREVEGKSINEIAKQVGCSWETAKKYADGSINLQTRARRKRSSPVMNTHAELVDAWLEEDQRRPRKQRRSAAKIFADLRELGFKGSDRTVRRYVQERRVEMKEAAAEQYIRLEHPPGTAQVDFGHFLAIHEGQEMTFHYLTMAFPFSNAQVAVVLPAENTACFLHGLATLFAQIGGVPTEIWFDNLAPAVKKVLHGPERELTEMFKGFEWHYRFRSAFCNPSRGNEKGHVEGKIGYIRRNFLTPIPVIEDLKDFNATLSEQMIQDRQRIHYTKKVAIADLWQEDSRALLTLPHSPLEIAQFHLCLVNRYGEVTIDKQIYRVPSASPGQKVLVKAFWDRLEILDQRGEEKLQECPRRYMMNPREIDWAAELELFVHRPRAIECATYLKALPGVLREYLLASDLSERRKRVQALIEVLDTYTLEIAECAATSALEHKRTDVTSLLSFAAYAADQGAPTPIDEPWTPSEVAQWQANLGDYDRLVTKHG